MNRSDLQTRILERLNESITSPQFWTTTQIDQVIDEGAEVLAEEARLIRRTVTTTVRPGASYYQIRGLAPDIMAIVRITLPESRIRLRAVSPLQLDAYHLLWETVSGTPRWWAPIDWQTFALFPHGSTGGNLMRVDYLAWPRALMDDTDSPEYHTGIQDALVLYGVYDGLLKRWDVARALPLYTMFLDRVMKARSKAGLETEDGRTWQEVAEPGVPFLSGMDIHYR